MVFIGCLAASKGKFIGRVENCGMMDVKRSPAVIGLWLKRIRDKRGRVCCDAGIHVVSIIERFRKCIRAAELQTMTEAVIDVHREAVIRTDALREPMRRIPKRAVGQLSRSRIPPSVSGGPAVRRSGLFSQPRTPRPERCLKTQYS